MALFIFYLKLILTSILFVHSALWIPDLHGMKDT